MNAQELGAWLRKQREARCWPRTEMARRLIEAAHAHGDNSMTDVDNLCHNIYRWERGKVRPGERYRLYYCYAFDIPLSGFGKDQAEVNHSADDLAIMALYLLAGALGLQRETNGEKLIIQGGKDEAGRSGNPGNARLLEILGDLDS